VILVNCYAC